MAKTQNNWTILVKKTMKENPGMKFKDVLKKAKTLYRKTSESVASVLDNKSKSKSKKSNKSSKSRKSKSKTMKKSRKSKRSSKK